MTPIVILHGWGSSSVSFQSVKNILLNKGFTVYVLDLPGFGRVGKPDKPWSVDDYVDFVYEYVSSRYLDKFYLLGHSFGGQVAIKFAVAWPEKLSGLILYSAAGIRPEQTIKTEIFYVLAKIGNFIFSLLILRSIKNFMRKGFYYLVGTRDYYRAEGVMKQTMEKVINEDLRLLFPNIQVPTLIIWGDKDDVTPISDAEMMKEGIRGAELKIMPGAGHSWHKEQTEKFVEFILPFISKT